MRVEVIGKGFVYRWPGGEVRLDPGKPIELPPERAAKLLVRAKGRVRIHRPSIDWQFEWRCLAAKTSGLTKDDPRLQPIMEALDLCDTAFLAGDYPAFTEAAVKVEEAMNRR